MKLRLSTALLLLLVAVLSVGCPDSEENESTTVGPEDGHEQHEPGSLEGQEPLEFDEDDFVEQPSEEEE